MSIIKHTPGPWEVGYSSPENIETSCLAVWLKADLDNGFGTVICKVSPEKSMNETDKANARLISCAPELLEMVKKLKAICESEIPEFNIPELNELIAKATTQSLTNQTNES